MVSSTASDNDSVDDNETLLRNRRHEDSNSLSASYLRSHRRRHCQQNQLQHRRGFAINLSSHAEEESDDEEVVLDGKNGQIKEELATFTAAEDKAASKAWRSQSLQNEVWHLLPSSSSDLITSFDATT